MPMAACSTYLNRGGGRHGRGTVEGSTGNRMGGVTRTGTRHCDISNMLHSSNLCKVNNLIKIRYNNKIQSRCDKRSANRSNTILGDSYKLISNL